MQASAVCACLIVRQLFHEGLIERANDPIPAQSMRPEKYQQDQLLQTHNNQKVIKAEYFKVDLSKR